MSVAEIKKSVMKLSPGKRHQLALWLIRIDDWADDADAVLATALAWRELDREEAEDEKRKPRRNMDR